MTHEVTHQTSGIHGNYSQHHWADLNNYLSIYISVFNKCMYIVNYLYAITTCGNVQLPEVGLMRVHIWAKYSTNS